MKKNIRFLEKKKRPPGLIGVIRIWMVLSLKKRAVELNPFNLLSAGKSCFRGHVKTLPHLTQLALLATFSRLGSCKHLDFASHLPVEMRCTHEMKDARVARQLVRPDARMPQRYEHIWYLDRCEAHRNQTHGWLWWPGFKQRFKHLCEAVFKKLWSSKHPSIQAKTCCSGLLKK